MTNSQNHPTEGYWIQSRVTGEHMYGPFETEVAAKHMRTVGMGNRALAYDVVWVPDLAYHIADADMLMEQPIYS